MSENYSIVNYTVVKMMNMMLNNLFYHFLNANIVWTKIPQTGHSAAGQLTG